MSPTSLSYDDLKQEFSQQLQKTQFGVLATSKGKNVLARQMMVLSDGEKVKCFTGKNTRKYKQIQANDNVALSINNLQIEGIATLTGHPSEARNAGFIKMLKERAPKEVYEFWSRILMDPDTNLVVIEITPRRITAYKASPTGSEMDILNIVTEKATKIHATEMASAEYDRF
jgi:general stress protein 26